MGKKAGKAPKGDGDEVLDPDQFTAGDFDWLDDPAKVKAAVPKPIDKVKKEKKK